MFRIVLCTLMLMLLPWLAAAQPARKIVLIAGPNDPGHPAGTHEYQKTVKAFKYCLENAENVKGIRVEAYGKGWPDAPQTLDDADAIVFVTSGSDRQRTDHPILVGDRLAVLDKQMKRGCGIAFIHWSTFISKDVAGDRVLNWVGGYFDYESGPAANGWYSRIKTFPGKALPAKHPITTGLTPFEIRDEFYYNIRFKERDPKLQPILSVGVPGESEQVVAWGIERADGGRGFGFTGGHFFENWRHEQYRRLALNAILWIAKADIPAGGVKSDFPGDRELSQVGFGKPVQVLILTGHDGPFHNWRETSQVLKHVLERDSRMKCRIVDDPEFLAREDLQAYGLIVQNYVNWERDGLSDKAKANLLAYLKSGRGLSVIHFANGAFHFSLPKAKQGDWPEYRQIVKRVWNHEPPKSGHDAFGPFRVEIAEPSHPITEGMTAFETRDELYYRQDGPEALQPLVHAKSKDTGKREPLAWAYQYGSARVFQTVLGHNAEAIRAEGPAQLIRRGSAWAAGLEIKTEKPAKTAAPKAAPTLTFTEGRFGKALDARVMPASIEGDDRFRTAPFTVECWAKLFSKSQFNILVSCDPKNSARHWELYTYAGTGRLAVYFPGMQPAEIVSNVDICDGKWHFVALVYDGKEARLYADGKQVREQRLGEGHSIVPVAGPLLIGGAVAADHRIGCDGLIDDVRFSKIVRPAMLPNAPLTRDADTISLWNLDGQEGLSADTNWTPPISANAREAWELKTDKDWVDGRFQMTDTGPFLNATIDYDGPQGKVRSYKATAIRLTESTAGLFDRNTCRFAALWSGGYLNHSSRRFGLLNTPTPTGKVFVTTSSLAGWADPRGQFNLPATPTGPLPADWVKFSGIRLQGRHVALEYRVHGIPVQEMIRSSPDDPHATIVERELRIDPTDHPLKVLVAEMPRGMQRDGQVIDDQGEWLVRAGVEAAKLEFAQGRVTATIPASKQPQRVVIRYSRVKKSAASEVKVGSGFDAQAKGPFPQLWPKVPETALQSNVQSSGPLALDTLTLPYDNPYKALFFVTGVDFLPDGRVAICTAHGDVWLVSGQQQNGPLKWKRFATGLYQTLGLKVVDGRIFVVERGQLTRLHDTDQNGEADFFESFNADWHAGGGEHSYDSCLETDPSGNFYLFKTGDDHTPTGGCLLKITPDGRRMEIFSTGFRHPIGLGMSPDGRVSGADQEGNWMPTTRLDFYRPGGFYGDMRTHHRPEPPKTYDLPYLWLPKEIDNSAGGQAWLPPGSFGPLGGKMIHLSYGRCRAFAILNDGDRFRGAAVDLGLKFLGGSARARYNPADGGLYVVGLDGWQTASQKDGSLQRVRYTGQPYPQPIAFSTSGNSLQLQFEQPLDPQTPSDLKRFQVQRWNYIWRAEYGSKDWSVRDPRKEGRDTVNLQSVTLSDDKKTLILKLEDLKPAMSYKISYEVIRGGKPYRGTAYTTINPE